MPLTLDPEQQAVVDFGEGHLCVAACAGSGKSRALTHRAHTLCEHGTAPETVILSTFTRAATAEISARLKKMGAPVDRMRIGTLHSVAYEIYKTSGAALGGDFTVDTGAKHSALLREVTYREDISPDGLDRFIELVKGYGIPAVPGVVEEYAEPLRKFAAAYGRDAAALVRLYVAYEAARWRERVLTFADMLLGAWLILDRFSDVRAYWAGRFAHVLVDEAQDNSRVQWDLVHALSSGSGNLCAVGDPAQGIFSFRAASPQSFVAFAKAPDTTLIRLHRNYRSPVDVCRRASLLIVGREWNLAGNLMPRIDAATDPAVFLAPRVDAAHEAREVVTQIKTLRDAGTPLQEIAVLARVTAALQGVEFRLADAGIPFVRLYPGGSFFDRREVRDLLSYLRVAALQDPDGAALKRCANAPFRYLGRAFFRQAEELAEQQSLALLDAMMQTPGLKGKQARGLREVHSILLYLNREMTRGADPQRLLRYVVNQTMYLKYLAQEDRLGGESADTDRAENVATLIDLAGEFPTVQELLKHADQQANSRKAKRRDAVAVQISTCHAGKGLEWDHVFLIGASARYMPHPKTADAEEERRVFYVAITRPRERLYISYVKSDDPSPFLGGIDFPLTVEESLRAADGVE